MYSCEEISIIEKYQYFIRLCFTTININIKKKKKKKYENSMPSAIG